MRKKCFLSLKRETKPEIVLYEAQRIAFITARFKIDRDDKHANKLPHLLRVQSLS